MHNIKNPALKRGLKGTPSIVVSYFNVKVNPTPDPSPDEYVRGRTETERGEKIDSLSQEAGEDDCRLRNVTLRPIRLRSGQAGSRSRYKRAQDDIAMTAHRFFGAVRWGHLTAHRIEGRVKTPAAYGV